MSLWSFQGARELERPPHVEIEPPTLMAGLSKLSSKTLVPSDDTVEVDMILGELNAGRNRDSIERVQRLPT